MECMDLVSSSDPVINSRGRIEMADRGPEEIVNWYRNRRQNFEDELK